MFNTIIGAIATIVVVTLILVALLLFIKAKLTPSGSVSIDINGGKKTLEAPLGGDLMHTLADQGIFLPSACGGKANCGQCKVQVLEGGGSILPTETGFFNRKQIKDGFRLGCQVKVKDNIKIQVPDSTLSVKKLECEVISNKNVATFIKEFTVRLPEGEHLDFKSGEYIQIDIPEYDIDFADIDVDDIYKADWEKYGFFGIKAKNTVPTVRAYSMASYPAEKCVSPPLLSTGASLRVYSRCCRFLRESHLHTSSRASLATRYGSAARSVSSSFRRTILRSRNMYSWAAVQVWPLSEATSCISSRP